MQKYGKVMRFYLLVVTVSYSFVQSSQHAKLSTLHFYLHSTKFTTLNYLASIQFFLYWQGSLESLSQETKLQTFNLG